MSQHDLNVANQTTPNFRSDMNNALVALGTLQSGATAPTTTFANMAWYDTTNHILKVRSEADDAWISVGYLDQSTNQFLPFIGSTQITAFKDEDDLSSDSPTAIPSQQSVKAYVDDGKASTMIVTEQRSSGVAGVTGSAASWTAYAINTTDYNGISGASLASNQITLPSGTYVVDGFGAAGNGAYNSGTSAYKVRLRNITDGTTAISGGGAASPTYAGATLGHIENLPVAGRITISGTKVFELQAWFNGGSSMQMYRAMGSGENEVYAGLKITKIS